MSRWKIKVQFHGTEDVIVEARDEDEATTLAEDAVFNDLIDLNRRVEVETWDTEELV